MNKYIISSLIAIAPIAATAQNNNTANSGSMQPEHNDSIHSEHKLQGVTVKSTASRRMAGALNGMVMGRQELFKAACCNPE